MAKQCDRLAMAELSRANARRVMVDVDAFGKSGCILDCIGDINTILKIVYLAGRDLEYSFVDLVVRSACQPRQHLAMIVLVLQIHVANWIEHMGGCIKLNDAALNMMVMYACFAVGTWDSFPPSVPNTSGVISDEICVHHLAKQLNEAGPGLLVRSFVASLRMNASLHYNFFARRNTSSDKGYYELRTTWLVPRDTNDEANPRKFFTEQIQADAHVDFRLHGTVGLGLYLQQFNRVWQDNWAITGAYCINHGYYEAYTRQRQGKDWLTQPGDLGAYLRMPRRRTRGVCLQYRGQDARVAAEHHRRTPCAITLHDIFSELLLHTAAQVLFRLSCLDDGRSEFLLVEVIAPHKLHVGGQDTAHSLCKCYSEDFHRNSPRFFYAQDSIAPDSLTAVSRQATSAVRTGRCMLSRVKEGFSKLKVE